MCTPTHPLRTPMHTRTHQRKLVHTPHIPTDALNLINHMKLHINGKMAEARKKKEQESAEAISRLKMFIYIVSCMFYEKGVF